MSIILERANKTSALKPTVMHNERAPAALTDAGDAEEVLFIVASDNLKWIKYQKWASSQAEK